MEWSDYGRVALVVAFVMICAAVTVALLEFLWLNVPWESIRSSVFNLVCYSTGSTALHADLSLFRSTGWQFHCGSLRAGRFLKLGKLQER